MIKKIKIVLAIVCFFSFFSCKVSNLPKNSTKMLISRYGIDNSFFMAKSVNISGSIVDVKSWFFSVEPKNNSLGPGFSKIGEVEKTGEMNGSVIILDSTQIELSYGNWKIVLLGYSDENMMNAVVKLETDIVVNEKSVEGEGVFFENGILVCMVEASSNEEPCFDSTTSLNNIKLIYNNKEADKTHWYAKFMTEADGSGDEITGMISISDKGYYCCYLCIFYDDKIYDMGQKVTILSPIKGLVYSVKEGSSYDIMNRKFNLGFVVAEIKDEGKVVSDMPVLKSKYVFSSSDYEVKDSNIVFNLPSEFDGADIYLNVVNPTAEKIINTPKLNIANNSVLSKVNDANQCIIRKTDDSDYIIEDNNKTNEYMKNEEAVLDISNEKVGTKKEFCVRQLSKTQFHYVTATCKYKATVDTANGKRTLLVYLDDSVVREIYDDGTTNGVPTYNDIYNIANIFLRDGFDNDLYDKLTAMFGNDIGLFNAYEGNSYLKDYPGLGDYFISNNDYITILIADLKGAYSFYKGNVFLNDMRPDSYKSPSNERSMIMLDAFQTGGEYMASSLTTLSQAFVELIYNQYYNIMADSLSVAGHKLGDDNIEMIFSYLAQAYTAHFIAEKVDDIIAGPFMIGKWGFEKGYIDGSEDEFDVYSGLGCYTLGTVGYTLTSKVGSDLYVKGLAAGLANYLLVNYGADVILNYMTGGDSSFDGLIEAVNKTDKQRNIGKKEFLLEYGDALLLSSNTNTSKPYSYNREGFYSVNGMLVYSVNLWIYNSIKKLSRGFSSSRLSDGNDPYSVNFYRVIENASAGENRIYVGTSFDENLAIDVVVVQ